MDPTPRIERGHGGFADRRLPTWQGRVGCWHQGKDLNPHRVVQSHGSYPLDDPGVFGALDGNRTRRLLFDRQTSLPADREGANESRRRGGGAPGMIRSTTPCVLACHAYSVFKVQDGQKKKDLASPGPLRSSLRRRANQQPSPSRKPDDVGLVGCAARPAGNRPPRRRLSIHDTSRVCAQT